jgi:hypothetical protein
MSSKPLYVNSLDPHRLLVHGLIPVDRRNPGTVSRTLVNIDVGRGNVEVDVLLGDTTGLGVLGSVNVHTLQHDGLLVSGKRRKLLGDEGRTTTGKMGTGEDDIDLGQVTSSGLGVEQPDEREGDTVLNSEQEESPRSDRGS